MDDRSLQYRVGIVMVSAVFIGILLLVLLGEIPIIGAEQNTIFVEFSQAPGVTVNTPVRTSGILIGRVKEVTLQENRKVLVTISVEVKYMPRQNEVCRISSGSLLGDAILEFVPGDDPAAQFDPLPDNAVITGSVSTNPLKVLVNLEDSLTEAIGSLTMAGNEVTQLAKNANNVIVANEGQLGRIVEKTEVALDHFDKTMLAINDLVADEELNANLKSALQDLPATLAETKNLLENMNKMVAKADKNLENLTGFTEPLGERGEELIANLEGSTENLNILIGQLAKFSTSINSQEGTLGQLIHNPDLYQRLNSAAGNLQDLSVKLKPIVADARVFVDKIARDPGRIGVKGALDRSKSGIK
ncbi:MAG: hypothetical protein COA78_23265 [Blastopirellula sp.]|nr:MAG: hypothetical protein COA78_23265 [Blastopirellula sp.]